MNTTIRRALLSAAALTLVVGPGLASCSKNDETATSGEATSTEAATGETAAGAPAGPEGEAQKNARALLKAMSDYLASQTDISLAYDSIFEVVSSDHQK